MFHNLAHPRSWDHVASFDRVLGPHGVRFDLYEDGHHTDEISDFHIKLAAHHQVEERCHADRRDVTLVGSDRVSAPESSDARVGDDHAIEHSSR